MNEKQQARHSELMTMNMGDWPKELYDYCVRKSKIYGASGGAIADWVEMWIEAQEGGGGEGDG